MSNESVGNVNKTIAAFIEQGIETAKDAAEDKMGAASSVQQELEETVNPMALAMKKHNKKLENRKTVTKMSASGEKAESLRIQLIEQKAEKFEQRNPELPAKTLKEIRENIKPDDTPEEILKKIQEHFSDVSLIDEVFEFLQETTEGALHQKITSAKEKFNAENKREIIAGHNIGTLSRETAKEGIDTPTNLRNLYRDITGNPRETNTLFEELAAKYPYKDLKGTIDFLLHSMGVDMKAPGPSIERAFLHRLFTETRSLQAILGVYNFFKGRMNLISGQFNKSSLEMPSTLTFESIAKQFMALANDRYPVGEKVLESATKLGLEKWILAKIIVLSQLRDAVKEVALNQIYKSIQHRDEFLLAILEALEDLEDELEEEEESKEDSDEQEEQEEK